MARRLFCATTPTAATPPAPATPLVDVGNLPARGARSKDEPRVDLYRCVHSYFRWRAETLESSKSYPSDCRRDDGRRRLRRRDSAAVTLASLSKGAETGAVTGVPDGGDAAGAGRPAEDATPAHRGAGGGEVGDADFEVEMCLRIVSALEEALPQLIGDCNSRSPEGADAGSHDDVVRGSDEENDGDGTHRLLHSAGVKDAVEGNLSHMMGDETRGGDAQRGTGKAVAASPAKSEVKEPPPADSPEDDKRSGTTDDRGKRGAKEGDPRHQSDDRSDPSRREGPDPPSPELETRYDAYPDHLRKIYELQARVLHHQREEINKVRNGMLHLQREVDEECLRPPQPQWPHQHPPFWHPSWPAPPPWHQQQQLPDVQFHRDDPNERAASASRVGKRARVDRPRQNTIFPTAEERGTAPLISMPPVVQPLGGRGETAVATTTTTTTRTRRGFGAGPVIFGVGRGGSGFSRGGISRGDEETPTVAAKIVPEASSSRKRGAATEENSGSGGDEFDNDDQSGSLLSKMSESEDGSVSEEDDDKVDSSGGSGIASDCDNVDSSENESEDEDDFDGPSEALDDDEVSTASAVAPENQETTVWRRSTTRPAIQKSPSSRTGKKKRHMDQESGTMAGQANTTTTATQNSKEDALAEIGTSAGAALGSVANEGSPGISSARKPRNTPAADVAMWEKRFLELVEYHGVHGHCRVPGTYKANRALANWVLRQRTLYASNRLSSEKVNRLNGLGFTWSIRNKNAWQHRYEELVAFKERVGHTRVPKVKKAHRQLGHWVAKQRYLYACGQLSDEKIERLNAVGFEWKISTRKHPRIDWEGRYQQLVRFQEKHGHCDVTPAEAKKMAVEDAKEGENAVVDNLLYIFTKRQRTEYHKFQEGEKSWLDREKIEKLKKIGFDWTFDYMKSRDVFDCRFEELLAFKERMGHTRVPQFNEANPQLGHWVAKQRRLYTKGHLADEKIERLNEVGFEWKIRMDPRIDWEARYQQLVRFREKHGHCDVTPAEAIKMAVEDAKVGRTVEREDAEEGRTAVVNDLLYVWTSRLRKEYLNFQEGKKSYLDERKIEKLDWIGFDWLLGHTKTRRREQNTVKRSEHTKVPWPRRLQQLCNFQLTHGHMNIPRVYEEDDNLGGWARKMRQMYWKHMRGNLVSEELQSRFEKLTELGFSWKLPAATPAPPKSWNERYQQLLEFQAERGHTRVPQFFAGDPTLAWWVVKQRRLFNLRQQGKKCSLNDDQIRMLNEIGFEWSVCVSAKKKYIGQLKVNGK